ncbi:MAG: glutamate--tRNA ligase [bacterium]
MSILPKPKKTPTESIRVRMAPSPTGPFHIGSARTALFNYLFAKRYGGKFIIRIEDTDQARSKVEWEDSIKQSFNWLGLVYDEGLEKGGPYGPYRQSERKEIYKKYIEKLLADKKAYWCFCSQEKVKETLSQIHKCDCAEKQNIQSGVIRFKTPSEQVVFDDLIKGKISYDSALFGDMVIAKNLDEPLYNLACVIDDYEMKISHVIRGEEHISNTPRQILLARALAIESPEFLHLPLILNEQRAKLSKRDPSIAAKVSDYIEQGYLPEAVVNFIALLGWNPGDDREIFSLAELEKEFSIEKIQKSGAVFNAIKMEWINGYFIRKMPLEKLTELCLPYLIKAGLTSGGEGEISKIAPMIALYQERLKKLSEIPELIDFFFQENLEYEKKLLGWKEIGDSEIIDNLDKLLSIISNIEEASWTKEKLSEIIMPIANEAGDRGKVLWPMRAALCGKKASSGPFEIAEVLGKEKTLQRIKEAIKKLQITNNE